MQKQQDNDSGKTTFKSSLTPQQVEKLQQARSLLLEKYKKCFVKKKETP